MKPERIEELADGCFGDRSNEVSQGVIVKAIRTAVNEALEEAAKLCDEAADLHSNGEVWMDAAEYCASEIRERKTTV